MRKGEHSHGAYRRWEQESLRTEKEQWICKGWGRTGWCPGTQGPPECWGEGGGPPSCLVARAGIRCSGLTLPPAPRLSPLQTGGERLRGGGGARSQMLDSLSRVGRRWGRRAKTVNTHVLLKQCESRAEVVSRGRVASSKANCSDETWGAGARLRSCRVNQYVTSCLFVFLKPRQHRSSRSMVLSQWEILDQWWVGD